MQVGRSSVHGRWSGRRIPTAVAALALLGAGLVTVTPQTASAAPAMSTAMSPATSTATSTASSGGADGTQPAASVTAKLSGRLMFDDGRPAFETKVELVASGREDSRAWTFTDPHGRWSLAASVPADAYQLRYVMSDGDWFWYPGTKDRDEADVLTVATSAGTEGLDVTWPPPARVRITVTDPSGRPLPGICLDGTPVPRCTKSQGVVTLPDVDSGDVVISGWSRSARWYLPASTLTLQRGETAHATLVAAPGATLRGTLLDPAEQTSRVCPEVFPASGDLDRLVHVRARCTSGTGTWQVTGLPAGRFRVRLALSTATGPAVVWWPMSAASNGARTLTGVSGQVSDDGSSTLPELGSLAGRVVDVDGDPVADAWVQVGTPDLTDPRGENSDHSATTGTDGHFRIDGLAAWTAPVMVTAPGSGYGASWSGGVGSADLAESVTIGWSRTTRVTLTLLPAAPLQITLAGGLVPGDSYRVDAVDAVGNVIGFGVTLDSDEPTGTVRGLAAGTVRLRVVHVPFGPYGSTSTRYYPDGDQATTASPVTLDSDGRSLTWTLPDGF